MGNAADLEYIAKYPQPNEYINQKGGTRVRNPAFDAWSSNFPSVKAAAAEKEAQGRALLKAAQTEQEAKQIAWNFRDVPAIKAEYGISTAMGDAASAKGRRGSEINIASHADQYRFMTGSLEGWDKIVQEDAANRKAAKLQSAGLRAEGNQRIQEAQQAELARLDQGRLISATLSTNKAPVAAGVSKEAQGFGLGFTEETKAFGYVTTGTAEASRQEQMKAYEAKKNNQSIIDKMGLNISVDQLNEQGISSVYNTLGLQATTMKGRTAREKIPKSAISPYLTPRESTGQYISPREAMKLTERNPVDISKGTFVFGGKKYTTIKPEPIPDISSKFGQPQTRLTLQEQQEKALSDFYNSFKSTTPPTKELLTLIVEDKTQKKATKGTLDIIEKLTKTSEPFTFTRSAKYTDPKTGETFDAKTGIGSMKIGGALGFKYEETNPLGYSNGKPIQGPDIGKETTIPLFSLPPSTSKEKINPINEFVEKRYNELYDLQVEAKKQGGELLSAGYAMSELEMIGLGGAAAVINLQQKYAPNMFMMFGAKESADKIRPIMLKGDTAGMTMLPYQFDKEKFDSSPKEWASRQATKISKTGITPYLVGGYVDWGIPAKSTFNLAVFGVKTLEKIGIKAVSPTLGKVARESAIQYSQPVTKVRSPSSAWDIAEKGVTPKITVKPTASSDFGRIRTQAPTPNPFGKESKIPYAITQGAASAGKIFSGIGKNISIPLALRQPVNVFLGQIRGNVADTKIKVTQDVKFVKEGAKEIKEKLAEISKADSKTQNRSIIQNLGGRSQIPSLSDETPRAVRMAIGQMKAGTIQTGRTIAKKGTALSEGIQKVGKKIKSIDLTENVKNKSINDLMFGGKTQLPKLLDETPRFIKMISGQTRANIRDTKRKMRKDVISFKKGTKSTAVKTKKYFVDEPKKETVPYFSKTGLKNLYREDSTVAYGNAGTVRTRDPSEWLSRLKRQDDPYEYAKMVKAEGIYKTPLQIRNRLSWEKRQKEYLQLSKQTERERARRAMRLEDYSVGEYSKLPGEFTRQSPVNLARMESKRWEGLVERIERKAKAEKGFRSFLESVEGKQKFRTTQSRKDFIKRGDYIIESKSPDEAYRDFRMFQRLSEKESGLKLGYKETKVDLLKRQMTQQKNINILKGKEDYFGRSESYVQSRKEFENIIQRLERKPKPRVREEPSIDQILPSKRKKRTDRMLQSAMIEDIAKPDTYRIGGKEKPFVSKLKAKDDINAMIRKIKYDTDADFAGRKRKGITKFKPKDDFVKELQKKQRSRTEERSRMLGEESGVKITGGQILIMEPPKVRTRLGSPSPSLAKKSADADKAKDKKQKQILYPPLVQETKKKKQAYLTGSSTIYYEETYRVPPARRSGIVITRPLTKTIATVGLTSRLATGLNTKALTGVSTKAGIKEKQETKITPRLTARVIPRQLQPQKQPQKEKQQLRQPFRMPIPEVLKPVQRLRTPQIEKPKLREKLLFKIPPKPPRLIGIFVPPSLKKESKKEKKTSSKSFDYLGNVHVSDITGFRTKETDITVGQKKIEKEYSKDILFTSRKNKKARNKALGLLGGGKKLRL